VGYKKNHNVELEVPFAASTFTLEQRSTNGWCVDKIEYGHLTFDLTSLQGTGAWLDDPCDGSYDLPCTNKLVMDVKSGTVTQKHAVGGMQPLSLPKLVVHTCNTNHVCRSLHLEPRHTHTHTHRERERERERERKRESTTRAQLLSVTQLTRRRNECRFRPTLMTPSTTASTANRALR